MQVHLRAEWATACNDNAGATGLRRAKIHDIDGARPPDGSIVPLKAARVMDRVLARGMLNDILVAGPNGAPPLGKEGCPNMMVV